MGAPGDSLPSAAPSTAPSSSDTRDITSDSPPSVPSDPFVATILSQCKKKPIREPSHDSNVLPAPLLPHLSLNPTHLLPHLTMTITLVSHYSPIICYYPAIHQYPAICCCLVDRHPLVLHLLVICPLRNKARRYLHPCRLSHILPFQFLSGCISSTSVSLRGQDGGRSAIS